MNQQESNNYALDCLLPELALIRDLSIRNLTTTMILRAPGLFWYRPSAYFPNHHPNDELKEWGNLIHTKRGIVIAQIFVSMEDLPSTDSDVLYSGLLIHDIGKYGPEGTEERIQLKTHAEIAMKLILANLDHEATSAEEAIAAIVLRHMGRWGASKPVTQLEKIASYCDCIGSRVNINIPIKLKLINAQ